MSLLQLEYDIMPFTFADILILRYLIEAADAEQTVRDFNMINEVSDLKWSFRSQIVKFIKRFWKDPYKNEEKKWMSKLVEERKIRVKSKFTDLQKIIIKLENYAVERMQIELLRTQLSHRIIWNYF